MKQLFKQRQFARELKRLARENAAQGKPLSILDDIVFKAMLSSGTEDSSEALRCLLSACIRREVAAVRVANNDLVPAYLAAKAARLDVHVTFNDGEAADLEMQLGKPADDLKTRAALYSAMLLSGQSRKGGPYGRIKRVYQIFFLNFVLFPDSGKLPRRYSYREETERDVLTEATEIIFYELPKLRSRALDVLAGKSDMKSLPEDEKWCIYMKYRHEEQMAELIQKLCREEAGIMRAEKAVTKIDRDYDRFARKLAELKNSMDRAQEIYNAEMEGRAEGLREGEARGEQKGRFEILELLKSGKSPEEIIKSYDNREWGVRSRE